MGSILNAIDLPKTIVLVVGVICVIALLATLFKKEIKQLLGRVTAVEGKHFRFVFSERVNEAKAQVGGVESTAVSSGAIPATAPTPDFGKQSARDVVLQAWGAVRQIVYDACMANNISLTPVTSVTEAVRRLNEINAVDSDVTTVIGVLDELGQQLADDGRLHPLEKDAKTYKRLSDVVINSLMLGVFPARQKAPVTETVHPPHVPPVEKPGSVRSATVVGEYFPRPERGNPVATLDGVEGPVKGQHAAVEKEYFRIGSNSDNDLCIADDDYVSGNHATLRYESGALYLYDQGSRNGTLLNEKRVTGAVMVRRGDRIRMGKSVFVVTDAVVAATGAKSGKTVTRPAAKPTTGQ